MSLIEYIFIITDKVISILANLRQRVVNTRKIQVILIVLIIYSTSYSFQSSGYLHVNFNDQDSNQISNTTRDQFNDSFNQRQVNHIANLEFPNKYSELEFHEGIFQILEKNSSFVKTSKQNPLHSNHIRLNSIISTIKVIDAPGTTISNLNLLNTSIELINSPNSIIINNRIHSLSNNSAITAISIVNSSNTVIMNNVIENSTSTNGGMTGILVSDSFNVKIYNNTMNNLISEISDEMSSISLGILISKSNFSNVTDNQITNIFGVSTSAIVIEKGRKNRIASNIISDITTFSTDRSESFGILLVNTESNVVENNNLHNIFANNLRARSFAFGISLTGVARTSVINNKLSVIEATADRPDSFGIHLARSNEIEIRGNYIEQVFSHSDIESRAFSTGIYMSHSENLIINKNKISQIIAEGRASYGIYADNSNLLEIASNSIYELYSTSRYQNTAEGIIIRIVNNTIISNNNISEIESFTINNGNNLAIPSSIGILVDNIINSTITQNYIYNVNSKGNSIPTDSIGILASSNRNAIIQYNIISGIYSKNFDSFSIGITSYAANELTINNNEISNIHSESNSILMYQAFSRHIQIINNSITISGAGEKINGIYSVKNFNESIFNNKIISNHQLIGVPAILVSFNELFNVYNNSLNDVNNNSVGIAIRSGNNGIIQENHITNFLLWMQMTDDSISVSCNGNRVDNIIHKGCIIGEFYDLVKLENELESNFITDTFGAFDSSNEFNLDTQNGNSNSYLIFLMILPIILAAVSSVIVKREQMKMIFTEIE